MTTDPLKSVWLTRRELAERWGLSANTLANWACEGRGPEFTRISDRRVLYALTDIEAYERDRMKLTKSHR